MTFKAGVAGAVLAAFGSIAGAQTVMETYFAEIAPVDRRNSSNTPLSDTAAILAQDRANVHRFGQRQSGDSVDSVFADRGLRAQMPNLLARGQISAAAEAAIRARGNAVLQVRIWGSGRSVSHVTIDLSGGPVEAGVDSRLSPAQTRQNAARIQSALNARGFDAGSVDGQMGRRTRTAIAAFQQSVGRTPTGVLTASELDMLAGAASNQGPSFDCNRAGTPTELAICANPALAALDRDLAEAWKAASRGSGAAARVSDQRRWLAERDACHSAVPCLDASMRGRIASLGGQVSQPSANAPAVMTASIDELPAATPTADGNAPEGTAETTNAGGLIYVDGRLLYSFVSSNAIDIPQGYDALVLHEQTLARRLTYTEWDVASDDLAAGLAATQNISFLKQNVDLLPKDAQDEVVRLGLSSPGTTETERDYCFNLRGGSRFSCATRRLQTEFDRRRFQQAAADIVARTAKANRFELPIPLRILCPLGQIDAAYDFEKSTVSWARMIEGRCRVNDLEINLASAVPEETRMDPDLVEQLARGTAMRDKVGQITHRPLMLSFDGELTIERTGTPAGTGNGMAEVRRVIRRVGPVSLKSSATPQDTILTFEGPTADQPADALDLSRAATAYRLIEEGQEVDAARLQAAAAQPSPPDDGILVRLPAWPADGDAGLRLSIANFYLTEEPAQRIATLTGQPLQHVGWTQLMARERGIPNTELVLVFPSPYDGIVSEPVDPEALQAARRGDAAFLLARISEPMRMDGAAGPTLVAAVTPLGFEIHEAGIGGATRITARPAIQPVAVALQESVFLPPAWWFAVKAAEQQSVDLDTHLGAVLDRSNLFTNDTFARLDALEEVRALIETLPEDDASPWIGGRVTLGTYDLDRQGWPVNGLNIALPVRDKTEARIARVVMPDIETSDLLLPMPVIKARAFRDERQRAGPLEFYAQIELGPTRSSSGLNVTGYLREMLLFPLEGSQSQPMQVSPAFNPDAALARFSLAPPQRAPAVEDVAAANITTPAAAPAAVAPQQVPVTSAEPAAIGSDDSRSDETWPALPDIEVPRGTWDILGLQTGMTVAEAEAVLRDRGGIVAIFDRPLGALDDTKVQALLFQRIFVTSDGTEAIILAAPTPDGPVLAIMRRLQLARGALPFETIRQSLIERYGDPAMQHPENESVADMYWFSATPGPYQRICRADFPRRVSIRDWTRRDGAELDLSQRPAAWDWAIADIPVDYAAQVALCGDMLSFKPETSVQQGGAAFTMTMLDAKMLRAMDEAMAGVPAAASIEIDF